jgi:carbon monoxide dehydrogenase subunit G
MHFEGEFSIPGKPADVIRRFADVPRMSACMPGAVLEPQAEDGSWPGGMVVSFGPKKIKFKGKATVDFDFDALTGSVHGRGTADMRAARIGVKVAFTLRDDPESPKPATIVKVVSDAELGGVLADFARTGGIAVAQVIMADFARRAAEEFSKDEVPEVEAPPPEPVAEVSAAAAPAAVAPVPAPPPQPAPVRPPPQPAAPLQASGLIWVVIKAYLARIGRFFGIGR